MQGFREPKGASTYAARNTFAARVKDYLVTALGWTRDSMVVHAEYDNRDAKQMIHVWLNNRQGVTFRIPDHELSPRGHFKSDPVPEDCFPTPADIAIIRLLNKAEPIDEPDTRGKSKAINKSLSLRR